MGVQLLGRLNDAGADAVEVGYPAGRKIVNYEDGVLGFYL